MPTDGERDIPLTSNKDNSKLALQRATISSYEQIRSEFRSSEGDY